MSIIIKIYNWKDIDIDKMSKFIKKARNNSVNKLNLSIEEIKRILNQYFRQDDIKYVTASIDNNLVGFLVIYPSGVESKEINPGTTLGGNPIIISNEKNDLICKKLINETIIWARNEGVKSLEIKIPQNMLNDKSVYKNYILTYEKLGFKRKLEYVEMLCNLEDQSDHNILLPENHDILYINEFSEKEIYNCYYNSFKNGDASFFQYQGEEEKLEYFRELGYPEYLNRDASIAIVNDKRLVGFSFVLPDGDNNHISCMCVHPNYQGLGFGKLILFIIMNKLKEQGIKTITLGTETKMRAFKLYNKYGFSITNGFLIYRWEQ
ncbi:MAG: GNAT family N-acetyltransferase [Promethearchaeota archaeon]